MSLRPLVIIAVFAAGAIFALWAPGVTTVLRQNAGAKIETAESGSKSGTPSDRKAVVAMDEERIRLVQIDQSKVGPGTIARHLIVPGTIVPDADHVAHVSVRLARSVAELRRNIGDDVTKGEILGAFESREVADAKSEYLASKLSDELQQDLAERDRSAWEKRAIPEQQYIRSRNAAAQTAMRFDIARQKLMALGVEDAEISGIPQASPGSLRLQNIRAPISGRLVERKVELGTVVGRDNLETDLFVIVDLSRVWVELSVSSADLPSIREGQGVSISTRGGQTGTAKVRFREPASR